MFNTGYLDGYKGVRLFYREWICEGCRDLVLFIHGLTGHSGKYIELGDFLFNNDFNVFMIDLRGHGRSEGKRGDIDSFDTYLQDLENVIKYVVDKYGERIFLSGHSMGGLISLYYYLKYRKPSIYSLILSAPGVKIGIKINPLLKRFLLSIPRSLLSFYIDSRVYPEFQTRDLSKIEEFKRDNLIFQKITVRLAVELFRYSEYVFKRAEEVDVPTLVFIGSDDKLVDPLGVKGFFNRISSNKKRLIEFKGAYHEIFNETIRKDAYREFINWINSF